MNQSGDEEKLRELFQQQREAVAHRTPSFNGVMQKAAERQRAGPRTPWAMKLGWAAAFGVIALVVGVSLPRFVETEPRKNAGSVLAASDAAGGRLMDSLALAQGILLSQWQAPTDSLLPPFESFSSPDKQEL